MSENKKPIIGIDLGIDPEYLEGVIRQTVNASIAEALGGKEAVASEIIHSVLTTEVDADTGRVPRYNTTKTVSIIEYYTRRVIREQAQEILEEVVENICDVISIADPANTFREPEDARPWDLVREMVLLEVIDR